MKVTTSVLFALILTAGAANAQTPPSADAHGAHAHATHAPATAKDDFDALDANKDGALSKTELAKHPKAAHAGMVDANRDGRLNRSEFAALVAM